MTENSFSPSAILWDMDGTLIDTEPYWIRAEIGVCSEHGARWTHDDGLKIIGSPLEFSAEVIRSRGVPLSVPDIIQRLLNEVSARVREAAPWQEDARRLLDRTVAAGIPCALVTMSYQQLADALTEQAPVFDAVVTGDMVDNGKPDPEPYLRAAEMLGVPIERCLAIEDSRPGVASAHASGARTVAVKRMSDIDRLEGLSRVTSLDTLTDEVIARIMGGAVIDDLAEEPSKHS
ncbi:MAG: HAD family phosphatase [Demequinaceae bacterium]|nr:HAD family phosphatase [Demequinaceae bacterium]